MQKILPCLWFDNQAEEAAKFYVSIFDNSKVGTIVKYPKAAEEVSGKKEGEVMTVDFVLEGMEFQGLNGGPAFKFTPAISFFVTCKDEKEIDEKWAKLSEGGVVRMEFGKYPFSEKYGWCDDKYGVSWQLSIGESEQKISTSFLFVGDVNGKAYEAINFYTSLFDNSKVGTIARYEAGEGDTEGHIKYSEFTLEGQKFIAMESGFDHKFGFSEAVSLVVNTKDQTETDRLWDKLTTDGGEEVQCGWLKDKYGVSWQITPVELYDLMTGDKAKSEKVMEELLKMKKLDINVLRKAYENA